MKFLQNKTRTFIYCLIVIMLFVFNCQNENDLLSVEEKSAESEQSKNHQSHLRAKDMSLIVDFVYNETSYTRQVVIDKSGIKKAKLDYRTSGMNSREGSETSFGYIDTSNALMVESADVISYTFKVVTKDLSNFINYIVVEHKATLDKYGYFMKYTPSTGWIQNRLPLSSFSGTIDYFNDNEELQTTLTLSEGNIVDFGEAIIPCPRIEFNPTDDSATEEGSDDPEDSSADNGSSGSSTGTGSGSSSNGGVNDGTSYYNPWEFFWTGWVSGGQDNDSQDQEIDAGDDGNNTGSSGGECCSSCEAAPGVECSHVHHNYSYNNRLGQISLKSEPTADNPCVHTGVIAFLIGQLDFTQEQVDLLMDIEYANVYEKTIDYLNIHNYSNAAAAIIKEFANYMLINGNDEFITELFDIVVGESSTDFNALKFALEAKDQDKIYNAFDYDFLCSVDDYMVLDTSNADLTDPVYIHYITKVAVLKSLNPEWSDGKVLWEATKDVVHIALDIFGMVPVVGEIADITNGVLYAIEGDGVNATLSLAAAIPFVGNGATISKYAIKIIETGGTIATTVVTRVKLVWKVTANGIEFGRSGQLRKVLGLTNSNFQAHHIIPWARRNHEIVQKAAKSSQAFHINQALNGIPIHTDFHFGSHPNYTNQINQYFEAFEFANPNATPDECYDFLSDLIQEIRTAIQNNPTTHINQLNF